MERIVANTFVRGDLVPVSFQAVGLAIQRLNIKGHTLKLSSLTFDVTHTGHGGQTARLGGKEDAKGHVDADLDLDLAPWLVAAPRIQNGVSGLCLFWIANPADKPNGYFQVPIIIPNVDYTSQVESQLKWGFDVEMNKIVGSFVYPAL